MRPRDHKVDFRSREFIADVAQSLRRHGNVYFRGRFDIVEFFESVICMRIKNVRLRFLAEDEAGPAYVEFGETPKGEREAVLHIDKEVWLHAKMGDGFSRLIVAHEIGHIILKHHHATPFSNDPSLYIKYAQNEYSAEWQADTFAEYLLLPDHIVEQFDSPERLISFCDVDEKLALERWAEVKGCKRARALSFDGDVCGECGNFTIVRNGTSMKCNTCGSRTG
jgi:IrrE N-terminal-like domain